MIVKHVKRNERGEACVEKIGNANNILVRI
jgi:hypothetical protein